LFHYTKPVAIVVQDNRTIVAGDGFGRMVECISYGWRAWIKKTCKWREKGPEEQGLQLIPEFR
jgi:hypothetical protein